jgi:heme oxygenase
MRTANQSEPFSALLRASTRAVHLEVERSAFMQALLKGTLGRPGYTVFQRNLFALYTGLEEALSASRKNPVVAAIFDPALFRAARLAADLQALCGPGWEAALPLMPAATAYAEHLRTLTERAPALLVAHVYVRSLGDLSGGQLVKQVVTETLRLGPEALSFYDFGSPDEVKRLAGQLRTGLAALPLDELQETQLVAEAVSGFERHRQLFGELATATL